MSNWLPPPPGPPPSQSWGQSNAPPRPQSQADYHHHHHQPNPYGAPPGPPASQYQQGPPLPNRPQAYSSQHSYGSTPQLPPRPSSTVTSHPPVSSVPAGYQAEVLQHQQHRWSQHGAYSNQPPSNKYTPHGAGADYGAPPASGGYGQHGVSYNNAPAVPDKDRFDVPRPASVPYQQHGSGVNSSGPPSYGGAPPTYGAYGAATPASDQFSNKPAHQHHAHGEQISSPYDHRPSSVPPWEQQSQPNQNQSGNYGQNYQSTPSYGSQPPHAGYSRPSDGYSHQSQASQSNTTSQSQPGYSYGGQHDAYQQPRPQSSAPNNQHLPGPPAGPPPSDSSPGFSAAQPANPYASGAIAQGARPAFGTDQMRPSYANDQNQHLNSSHAPTAAYNHSHADMTNEPVSPLQRPSYDSNMYGHGNNTTSGMSGPPSRNGSLASKMSSAGVMNKTGGATSTGNTIGASALGFGGPSDWQYLGPGDEEVDDTAMYGTKVDDAEHKDQPTGAVEMPASSSPTLSKANTYNDSTASGAVSPLPGPSPAQTAARPAVVSSEPKAQDGSPNVDNKAASGNSPSYAPSPLAHRPLASPPPQAATPHFTSQHTAEPSRENPYNPSIPSIPSSNPQPESQHALAKAQEELKHLHATLSTKDAAIAGMQAKSARQREEDDQYMAGVREELSQARQGHQNAQREVEAVRRELDVAREAARELVVVKRELDEAKAAGQQLDVVRGQLDQAKAEAVTLAAGAEAEKLKLQDSIREGQVALENARSSGKAEMAAKLQEFDGVKKEYEQKCKELEQKHAELEQAKAGLETKVQAVETEKQGLQTRVNDTEAYFKQTKAEFEDVTKQKAEQDEKLKGLEKELEEAKKAADYTPGLEPWFKGSLDRFKDALYEEAKAQQIQSKLKVFMDFVNAEAKLRGIDLPFGPGGQLRGFNAGAGTSAASAEPKKDAGRPQRPSVSTPPSSDFVMVEPEEYSPGGRPILKKQQEEDEYSPGGRPIIKAPRGQPTAMPAVNTNRDRSQSPAKAAFGAATDASKSRATAPAPGFQAYKPGTRGSVSTGSTAAAIPLRSSTPGAGAQGIPGEGPPTGNSPAVAGLPELFVRSPVAADQNQQRVGTPRQQQQPQSPSHDAPIPVLADNALTPQALKPRSRSPSPSDRSSVAQHSSQAPPPLAPGRQPPRQQMARQESPARAQPSQAPPVEQQRQQPPQTRSSQGQQNELKTLLPPFPLTKPTPPQRMEDIRKALTRYTPADFSFIASTNKTWETTASATRIQNEKARRKRLEESEQRVNDLFDAEEIGYGDIAELEDEAKEAEAVSQAEEENAEYTSYAKEVFDVVFRRLQDDLAILTRMYADAEKCVKDAVAGQKLYASPPGGTPQVIDAAEATSLLLQVSTASEARHAEIAKAVAERDRRYKRTQTKPLYARGDIAEMKKMERAFETGERRADVRAAVEKVERCKRLWRAVDDANSRGIRMNHDFADALLQAAEGVPDPAAARAENEQAREVLDTLARSSKSLLADFERAESLLNDCEFNVSVASARLDGAGPEALAKLQGEKDREDGKLHAEGKKRMETVEGELTDALAAMKKVEERKAREPVGRGDATAAAPSAGSVAGGSGGPNAASLDGDEKQRRLKLALEAAKRRNGDLS